MLKELVEFSTKKEVTDIVVLHEHRGQPDGMIISHMPLGPTLYLGLKNVIMRHDLKKKPAAMSEAYPHLIFNNFKTKLGVRIKKIL
jgi:U3 small nucleolar ribonucleoprotein protein IMP4